MPREVIPFVVPTLNAHAIDPLNVHIACYEPYTQLVLWGSEVRLWATKEDRKQALLALAHAAARAAEQIQ